MATRRTWLLVGALMLFGAIRPALAQQPPSFWLETLRQAYQSLDYERAEETGNAILRDYQAYSPDQLTEVYTTLAIIHFSRDNLPIARRHFESALALTPTLDLDPALTSPKILSFFDEIRAARPAVDTTPSDAEVRYVMMEDPRPAAAVRSMLLPGWGQLYKEEPKRGRLFMISFAGLGAGTLTAHILRNEARSRYRNETDPSRIEDRYQSFNSWHKTRNNLALATGTVWVASYIDALLRPANIPTPTSHQSRFQFQATPVPAPQLAIRIAF